MGRWPGTRWTISSGTPPASAKVVHVTRKLPYGTATVEAARTDVFPNPYRDQTERRSNRLDSRRSQSKSALTARNGHEAESWLPCVFITRCVPIVFLE